LINSNINLDQLLAIHNGMKYPLAYIQGPQVQEKQILLLIQLLQHFLTKERYYLRLIIIIL